MNIKRLLNTSIGWKRASACPCEHPQPASKDAKRVVTLVHGTFAKHADWIQEGQILTKALCANDDDTVLDRFCWSGKNRHTKRIQAGDELREHLIELITSYKNTGVNVEHHIIAHSHGGNVALYALRDRGDENDALLADVKLITLATPFLFMRERPLSKLLFLILPLSCWVSYLDLTVQPVSQAPLLPTLIFMWSFIGLVAFPLSLLLYWVGRSSPPLALWDLISGNATRAEAQLITPPHIDPARLYIIRGIGDEASVSLGAAQLINWIMTRLIDAYRNYGRFVMIAFAALIVISIAAESYAPWEAILNSIGDLVAGGFVAILLIPLAILPLIAGFVAMSNFPFGTDTLFWSYFAQTTAEPSAPGASHSLVVGTRHFHYHKLSHGVYEDVEAIRAIIARIKPRIELVSNQLNRSE